MSTEEKSADEMSNILPDAYREAICQMDLLAIYDLIPEYDYWDETQPNKSSLVSIIRRPLAAFKFMGETSLNVHQVTCQYINCQYKKEKLPHGYTFVGNTYGCLVSLKFEFKDNHLFSVSECEGLSVINGDKGNPLWVHHVLSENEEWRIRLRLDREKQASYPCSWI